MSKIKNYIMSKLLVKIFNEVSTTSCSNKCASSITLFDAMKHYKPLKKI